MCRKKHNYPKGTIKLFFEEEKSEAELLRSEIRSVMKAIEDCVGEPTEAGLKRVLEELKSVSRNAKKLKEPQATASMINGLDAMVSHLSKKLAPVQSAEQLNAELDAARETADRLARENYRLGSQCANLEVRNAAYVNDINMLARNSTELTRARDMAARENSHLQEQMQRQRQKIASLQKELSECQDGRESARERIVLLKKKLKNATDTNESLKSQINRTLVEKNTNRPVMPPPRMKHRESIVSIKSDSAPDTPITLVDSDEEDPQGGSESSDVEFISDSDNAHRDPKPKFHELKPVKKPVALFPLAPQASASKAAMTPKPTVQKRRLAITPSTSGVELRNGKTTSLLTKWRSKKTGLTVVHVDYDAPIVKGYFVLATEIFDDSGCPHTLEHLVFMGSEQYPYKGVLDNLANRAFSQGTNAWTDTDHTAYTISTAGAQGFLQLLPVYVDHILYPRITNADFVTEVHHINSKAENAGVVYSEMQGRQNTPGDLMNNKMQTLFNPEGSAYRSETGGLMEALRVLTVEQIRNYHKSYYVPHNLCLIVSGKLKTEELLHVLQTKVEPSILAHGPAQGPKPAGWKRPFVETASSKQPNLKGVTRATVDFPEQDESAGEVGVSFQGPPPAEFTELKASLAMELLGIYLTDSPVSPLTKEFVETANPLCTYIYCDSEERATFTTQNIYFGSVPTDQLEELHGKVIDSLKKIVADGIDMDRIRLVIKRDRLKLKSSLESSGGDVFSNGLISEFLYGKPDGSELAETVAEMQRYTVLEKWSPQQWAELLNKYWINGASVVVGAKPSAKLQGRLESEEKARIEAQRKALGPEGLAKLEKELNEAKAEHDQPIPEDMLTSFPVPDVSGISQIPVQSARNDPFAKSNTTSGSSANVSDLQKHLDADPASLPYFVQYDHVQSDFVTISAWISTTALPPALRPYITLYLGSFFALPVTRADGTKLSHEDLVKQLDEVSVAYEADYGVNGYFADTVRVAIKAEVSQYETIIGLLRDLLYSPEYTKDRLEVNVAKLLQSLPEQKRDGNTVMQSVSNSLLFETSKSVSNAGGIITQMDFIPELAKRLQESPEEVIKDMKEFRKHVTNGSGLRFSVTGNVIALKRPRSAWKENFEAVEVDHLEPISWSKNVLSSLGKNPTKKAVVVSLPTIESSYATHTSKSIIGFDHPEFPALRLACEVLDGTESFLWKLIRGSGLAYGANMLLDVESGHLSFTLYRAPDSYKAFQAGAKAVQGLVDGSIELNETALDAAKSSLVFSLTRRVSSPGKAGLDSFVNQVLKEVPQDHGRQLLTSIQAVDLEGVRAALKTHVLPLFDPETSVAVVASSPSKATDISDGLKGSGFAVELRTLDFSGDEEADDSDGETGSSVSSQGSA
ncbi:hypothetical protein FRC07_001710 [Ceratobasidium sp. 392]|nr:hypothetical protein FRC07_001710 [Ceratobasidium sp. 392]